MNKVKKLSKCLLRKVKSYTSTGQEVLSYVNGRMSSNDPSDQIGYVQGYVLQEELKEADAFGEYKAELVSFLKKSKLFKKDVVIQGMFGDFKMDVDVTKKGKWKGTLVHPHRNGTYQVMKDVTFYPVIAGARSGNHKIVVGIHPDEAY